ncbi:MAG: hypothetical protein KF894_28795 [Labilithrix sp.]|nr:hypothetical protein [Labilithrix sp.]
MKRPLVPTLVVAVLGVLSMAPTAGDVGGCGTEVTALDPLAFALARKDMDCERCAECGLETARCRRACDPASEVETVIPPTCQPLRHDGVVCIRKLHAASCSAYATYVDDAPSTPSECEFCKIAPGDRTGPGFDVDAASGEETAP